MERAIAYFRVSTQRQHRSGLDLEAQRTAIERFAANESLTIMAEYVEAGVEEFIVPDFNLGGLERKLDTMDMLIERVAPAFR